VLVDELRSDGGEALAVECDVTVDADAERLIAAGIELTGRVDVLVNAAGIAPPEDDAIESPDLFAGCWRSTPSASIRARGRRPR